MKRFQLGLIVVALGAFAAFGLASCGDDETTTVTETPVPTTATTPTTTSAPTTTATPEPTTAPTTTDTTTTGAGPQDCGKGEVFSEVSNSCIEPNTSGGNPCPKGQVPAADRGTCEAKD